MKKSNKNLDGCTILSLMKANIAVTQQPTPSLKYQTPPTKTTYKHGKTRLDLNQQEKNLKHFISEADSIKRNHAYCVNVISRSRLHFKKRRECF